MKLRPVGDHIIVKAVSKEETSASGIIIPDTIDKERSERGEVIAVGSGRELEAGKRSAMDVAVGNQVLFKKYAPDEEDRWAGVSHHSHGGRDGNY